MKKFSKTGNSTDSTKSEMLDPEGNLMMDKVGAARKNRVVCRHQPLIRSISSAPHFS